MPNKCPYCGALAHDGWEEKYHMEQHHPEIIIKRLKDAGMHFEAHQAELRLKISK